MEELSIPIKGISDKAPNDKQQAGTSPYLLNVRPIDTLERKVRLGQRPGLVKVYTQQIASVAYPIVAMAQIITVD